MAIDLGEAIGQIAQQTRHAPLGHGAGPRQSEHAIRRRQTLPANSPAEQSGPRRRERPAAGCGPGLDASQHLRRFGRHAHRAHAVAFPDVEHLPAHRRVQMEVMVRIDMVERQTGRLEGFELCLDFRGELPARAGSDEDVDARPHQIASQSPMAVDEIRDAFGRQHRPSVDEHQVQPNTKRRQTTRACQRVVDSSASHHQACRREDARCVRELDAFVDLRRQAEIVGRDDQRLQCATSRRSRRK